jgi:hypothetical protein
MAGVGADVSKDCGSGVVWTYLRFGTLTGFRESLNIYTKSNYC